MATFHHSGSTVKKTLPLRSLTSGSSIIADQITLTVSDADGTQLTQATFAASQNDTSITYTVESQFNVLATGENFGSRRVTIDVTDVDGALHTLTDRYYLRTLNPYTVGVDILATVEQAELLSLKIGREEFCDLPEASKEAVLVSAWKRIKGMSFSVCSYNDGEAFTLGSLTEEQYAALPDDIIGCILEAAVVDALAAQDCNSFEAQREAGLVSVVSGSSSHFFRNGAPIDTPLSKGAMKILNRILTPVVYRIGRG